MFAPMKCAAQIPAIPNTNHSQGASVKNAAAGVVPGVSHYPQPRLSCVIQNGIPVVRGASASYYIFNQKGQRLLILTRKQNESIIIDNTIDVVVLEINSDKVKLGIICPDDTPVRCEDAGKKVKTPPRPR